MQKFSSCSEVFIHVRSPSNIALVKYWGKKDNQLPLNPSLSMTLENCFTEMRLTLAPGASYWSDVLDFRFEGRKAQGFLPKIEKFLTHAQQKYSFLTQLSAFKLESSNSFPHSAGIASSASAFSALAFALEHLFASICAGEYQPRAASELARMGSGSACRSIGPGLQLWGNLGQEHGSDLYALTLDFHESLQGMRNSVLILDSSEKAVSSSQGHALMNKHPFREARIRQANENILQAIKYSQSGDFSALGKIIEDEALTLHAMMMTSSPSFILLSPNSLKAIELIRSYRQSSGVGVFFTIDAGPNMHVLYLAKDATRVKSELLSQLRSLCQQGMIIDDVMGEGAQLLEMRIED